MAGMEHHRSPAGRSPSPVMKTVTNADHLRQDGAQRPRRVSVSDCECDDSAQEHRDGPKHSDDCDSGRGTKATATDLRDVVSCAIAASLHLAAENPVGICGIGMNDRNKNRCAHQHEAQTGGRCGGAQIVIFPGIRSGKTLTSRPAPPSANNPNASRNGA